MELPFIDIKGEGNSTTVLLEKTDRIVNKSNIIYQNVWLVFDKDDFLDFDEAIKEAQSRGYSVAWSNQSFEYWIFLHFHYSDTALHRDDWVKKIDEIFKNYGITAYGYEKNDEDLFELVNMYGGMEVAIKNAKRRMTEFEPEKMKPSDFDPGTTVYLLVEELKRYMYE